jgi:hypothetical protein
MNRITAALIVLAAGCGLLAPAPAVAGPEVPRPAYLAGTELHLAGGGRVPVPRGVLFGRTAGGWVVGTDDDVLVVHPDGRSERVGDRVAELYQSEMLSGGGRYLVTAVSDQADGVVVSGLDVREGRSLRGGYVSQQVGATLAAVRGRTYYLSGEDGLLRNRLGGRGERTWLTRLPTDLVDPRHDVVFVRPGSGAPYGAWGPTSLAAPGAPLWLARRFDPVVLSPRGDLVLGRDGRVLRMADGSQAGLVVVPPPDPDGDTRVLGWADGQHVLVVAGTTYRRSVLQRCEVATGACRSVAGPTSGPITLPTRSAGPYVQP